jgi:hypothetical protein
MACPWDNPLLLLYEPKVEEIRNNAKCMKPRIPKNSGVIVSPKGRGTLTTYHQKYQLAPRDKKRAGEKFKKHPSS